MVDWELYFSVHGRTRIVHEDILKLLLAKVGVNTTATVNESQNSTFPVLLESNKGENNGLSEAALVGVFVTIGTFLLIVILTAFGKRCFSRKRREHWLPCHTQMAREDGSPSARLSIIQVDKLLSVYNSVRLDSVSRYSAGSRVDVTKEEDQNNNISEDRLSATSV